MSIKTTVKNNELLITGSGNVYINAPVLSNGGFINFDSEFTKTSYKTPGTYVHFFSENTTIAIIEIQGAGGGGGSSRGASGGFNSAGGSGGAGAYASFVLYNIPTFMSCTIGSGGAGGAGGANATNGGSTTVIYDSETVTVGGGNGGEGAAGSGAGDNVVQGGIRGTITSAPSTGLLNYTPGEQGSNGIGIGPAGGANSFRLPQNGGNSFYGAGGAAGIDGASENGQLGAGGGAGASTFLNSILGGNGGDGFVFITEYQN